MGSPSINRSENTAAKLSGDREAGAELAIPNRPPRRPQLPPHRRAEAPLPQRRAARALPSIAELIESAREALRRREEISRGEIARAVYVGFLAAACRRMAIDLQIALDQLAVKSRTSAGLRASSAARQASIYLAHWVGGIRQADIARAAGLTRVSVCLSLDRVERKADRDTETAALLSDIEGELVGLPQGTGD